MRVGLSGYAIGSGESMRTALVAVATAFALAVLVLLRSGGISALAAGSGDDADSYAFLHHQPGNPQLPVTYSSCKPVRVEINLSGAQNQAAAKQTVLQAMGEVSAASHLNLVYTGPTQRRPHFPDQTLTVEGGAWPVLIAFSDPQEVPDLKGRVDGVGGSSYLERPDRLTYVTGQVAIDKAAFNDMLSGYGGKDSAKALVMHELGHVLGLDHVRDRSQLMYASGNSSNELEAGDRHGLVLLGQGACT
jgi:hypothetical protein